MNTQRADSTVRKESAHVRTGTFTVQNRSAHAINI